MRKTVAAVLLLGVGVVAFAKDWPQWGGTDDRNFASAIEKNLPVSFEPGRKVPGTREFDRSTAKNIKWIAPLGTQTYGNFVVADGRVFLGTNAETNGKRTVGRAGGSILCLDEKTGQRIWELQIPRFITDKKSFNFDDLSLGVCSAPTVEGNRAYVVGSRGEVLCMDVEGQANGNDGPFTEEAAFQVGPGTAVPPDPTKTQPDIIWMYDMLKEVPTWPQDAVDCSILIHGDLLYVCTSNGVDRSHKNLPIPDAPGLIVLDKRTGKCLAADDAKIGWGVLHGQWSNPSKGVVNGKTLIFWGGGDGFCYAFDADIIPGKDGQRGILKTVWKADCNPPGRREQNGVKLKYPTKFGPSEIISTPVFYKDRVYVAVGQDPRHGKGPGNLVCIDATKTGDITTDGILWSFDKVERSLSTVSIYDGLLFVADFSGFVYCLDVETGKHYWTHGTESPLWSATFAADGKVWLGTERGELFTFAADREKRVLSKILLDNRIYTTPIAANGVLYVSTQTYLYAARKDPG